MAIEQENLDDFITVVNKLYREANPNGRMSEPPSSMYESMEKHYSAWSMSTHTISFYEYLKGLLTKKQK